MRTPGFSWSPGDGGATSSCGPSGGARNDGSGFCRRTHQILRRQARGGPPGPLGGTSTAIECILGTRQPDSGTIRLLGQDPRKHRSALFQRIGVQFQEGDYPPEIRVSELCRETASLYRRPADWHRLCREFGIGDKQRASVKSLSGGERQRLFIVLALIPQPELVFLDELTTGLEQS